MNGATVAIGYWVLSHIQVISLSHVKVISAIFRSVEKDGTLPSA